jgi:hypothetical protein
VKFVHWTEQIRAGEAGDRSNGGGPERHTRGLKLKARVNLLDYVDKKCCLIYGLDTSITITYNPSAISDILNIVLTKNLLTPLILSAQHSLTWKALEYFNPEWHSKNPKA